MCGVGMCLVEVWGLVMKFIFLRLDIILWMVVGDRLSFEYFDKVCELMGWFLVIYCLIKVLRRIVVCLFMIF